MQTRAVSPRLAGLGRDMLTAAGPPLAVRPPAVGVVLLRLFVAFWLQLDTRTGPDVRGHRLPAATRRFAAQGWSA